MVTREEKQRRKQLAAQEVARREAIGWKQQERPLAKMEATAEQKIAESKQQEARTEEEEASRITKILGGLKSAGGKAKQWATTYDAEREKRQLAAIGRGAVATGKGTLEAAKITGRGAQAVGRGAAATGRFVTKDLQQTGRDIKGASKWAWGAGGAVVGATVAGGRALKERGYTNVLPFFLWCVFVFLVELSTNFTAPLSTRVFLYYATALWASYSIFNEIQGLEFKHIITVLLVAVVYTVLEKSLLPLASSWPPLYLIISVIGLATPFLLAIKLGSTSFLISFVCLLAPYIKGVLLYYGVNLGSAVLLGMDAIIILIGLLWIFVVLYATPNIQKPLPVRLISWALIIVIVVIGFTPAKEAAAGQLDKYAARVDVYGVGTEAKNMFTANGKYLYTQVKDLPKQAASGAKTSWKAYMDFATAGAYTANVDKENIDKWVVKIDEAYAWQETYTPGSSVTVEAVFSGQRTEERVDVSGLNLMKFGCRTTDKSKECKPVAQATECFPKETETTETSVLGCVYPKCNYLVNLIGGDYSPTGKQTVTCTLEGIQKSTSVEIYGDLNFDAASELPVVFITPAEKAAIINTERMRELSTKPLAQPIGTGPVTIAIEFEETYPILVQSGQSTVVKITVEDQGGFQSRINGMSNFLITTPKGTEIASCTIRNEKTTTPLTVIKKPDKDEFSVDTNKITYPIEDFAAFKCNLKFKGNDVLSGKAVLTEKIKISTSYVYEIAKPVGVKVEQVSATGVAGQCGYDIVEKAKTYLGKDYVWGGESEAEGGFDCSGLVYAVYNEVGPKYGINVGGRTGASAMFNSNTWGTLVEGNPSTCEINNLDASKLQPGDIMFFKSYKCPAGHTGIYAGGGNIIHASSGKDKVAEEPLNEWFRQEYRGARRLCPAVSAAGTGGITSEVGQKIIRAAKSNEVPPYLLLAIAQQETNMQHTDPSTGNVKISSSGAIGIMQIMPDTASGTCGYQNVNDLYDIDKNIYCGAMVLRSKDGASKTYSCGQKIATYEGWWAKTRGYVGWGCMHLNYVEEVKQKCISMAGSERECLNLSPAALSYIS